MNPPATAILDINTRLALADHSHDTRCDVRRIHGPNEHASVAELQRRSATMELVPRLVRELRTIKSLRKLLDAAPEAVCKLGFDRALVSRVEESTWIFERFHSRINPQWAEKATAVAEPQRLSPDLFEADMVRRRTPVLVLGAQDEPRVNRSLADGTRVSSYVAAPILPEGRVIGFLHADRFHQGREVDEFDLEVLTLFADLFGQVLERAVLMERIGKLSETIGSLSQALVGTVKSCQNAAVDMSTDGSNSPSALTIPLHLAASAVPNDTPVAPDSVLTARELDVLRLMASGDTNSRIASRLVISEGTVKSHVKHILRKLGAANRAEAVCRWLQRGELAG